MDEFERKEMEKKIRLAENTLNRLHKWQVNQVPEAAKKPVGNNKKQIVHLFKLEAVDKGDYYKLVTNKEAVEEKCIEHDRNDEGNRE